MSNETESSSSFGCLFCVTGKEEWVANRIEESCSAIRAIVAKQEKHKSQNGVKTRRQAILLPSYVFFEAPSQVNPLDCFPREHVIRLLTVDGSWRLTGEDERFVQWLFRYNGLLGFSKAFREGERIRIVSGPLKDLEGSVSRIDRRGRSGQVTLTFGGRKIAVWLGFELVDSLG